MLFKDSGIFSPKIDSSHNLVFTIKVKREDYTEWMTAFIFDTYNKGSTIDLQVVWLEEKDTEIPKLRQRLAMVMEEYSKKSKEPLESLKNSLYSRYKVKSRSELDRGQLEESIRFYQDGILYD